MDSLLSRDFFLLLSSEYDMCTILDQNSDGFCTDDWPADKPCSCPLKAGDYDLHDIAVNVPDFGILNDLMVVCTLSR